MHTENLKETYTSGPPPREGDVSGRQKNAFLRKWLFPERRKWVHMPEPIILWSEAARAQPDGADGEKNGTFFRMIGADISLKWQQTGRLCRSLCHLCLVFPADAVKTSTGAAVAWPTSSSLTFLHNVVSLPCFPQKKQMFWPWFLSGAVNGAM